MDVICSNRRAAVNDAVDGKRGSADQPLDGARGMEMMVLMGGTMGEIVDVVFVIVDGKLVELSRKLMVVTESG